MGAQAEHNVVATAREFWEVNALAAAHGISRRHVYELMSRGVLSARKIGRKTLIPEASRRAWLDSLPQYRSSRP